jgi:hypothetical protein
MLNPGSTDEIVAAVAKAPVAATAAMAELWNEAPSDFVDVVDLHTINRATAAYSPEERKTLNKRLTEATMPTGSRADMLNAFHDLENSAAEPIQDLVCDSRAVTAFDILLMALAPTLYKNAFWMSTLTGAFTDWIAHSSYRLLTARQLVAVLAGDVGAYLLAFCEKHGMPSDLLDAISRVRVAALNDEGLATAIRPTLVLYFDPVEGGPKLGETGETASSRLSRY